MMKYFLSLVVAGSAALGGFALNSAFAAPDTANGFNLRIDQEWLTDYKQALEKAKKEDKQVLMDFTGSDWCGACIQLDRDVFSKKEFKNYAAKNLVLLKLDFPMRKRLPADLARQNETLQRLYSVEGYPTLIVLNPNGSVAGRSMGYIPGGPAGFIRFLKSEAPKK